MCLCFCWLYKLQFLISSLVYALKRMSDGILIAPWAPVNAISLDFAASYYSRWDHFWRPSDRNKLCRSYQGCRRNFEVSFCHPLLSIISRMKRNKGKQIISGLELVAIFIQLYITIVHFLSCPYLLTQLKAKNLYQISTVMQFFDRFTKCRSETAPATISRVPKSVSGWRRWLSRCVSLFLICFSWLVTCILARSGVHRHSTPIS